MKKQGLPIMKQVILHDFYLPYVKCMRLGQGSKMKTCAENGDGNTKAWFKSSLAYNKLGINVKSTVLNLSCFMNYVLAR